MATKTPTTESIAASLTVSEQLLLFCIATDTDWAAAGITGATARLMQVRGGPAGCGTPADCAKARHATTIKAAARSADLAPAIADIRAGGAISLRAIARELDGRGITAPRGGTWSAGQSPRGHPGTSQLAGSAAFGLQSANDLSLICAAGFRSDSASSRGPGSDRTLGPLSLGRSIAARKIAGREERGSGDP
jgi:hypothetical protein